MVHGLDIRYATRYSATRQFLSTTALHLLRRGFCTLVLFIIEVVRSACKTTVTKDDITIAAVFLGHTCMITF